MYKVSCHYCHTDLYIFQSKTTSINPHNLDGGTEWEDTHICYWCSLKEDADGGTTAK